VQLDLAGIAAADALDCPRGVCSGTVRPGGTRSSVVSEKYEVTGYDKEGRKVFHVLLGAVNPAVAKLYATAHLQRTPDGSDAVRSAVKPEAHLRDRLVVIREEQ
jgi:hypothetical protein